MAELTAQQLKTRERAELLIKLMAPALDLVLACGERLSRLVEPNDYEYYPVGPIGSTDEKTSDTASAQKRRP